MAKNIKDFKIDQTIYTFRSYGTCETAASTAAKVVTDNTDFVLYPGATILVKFAYTNSAGSATLNVNNTGAKTIRYNAAATTTATRWPAGSTVEFYYDGTYWQVLSMQLPFATESGMGILSTAAQNIAGVKTFYNNIELYKAPNTSTSTCDETPHLVFKRGTTSDTYNDWDMYNNSSGKFILRKQSSGTWKTIMTGEDSKVTFGVDGTNNVNVIASSFTGPLTGDVTGTASYAKSLEFRTLPSSGSATTNPVATKWCKFATLTFNDALWSNISGYLFISDSEGTANAGILYYQFRSGADTSTTGLAKLNWLVKNNRTISVIASKVADCKYDLYINNANTYISPTIYNLSKTTTANKFTWNVGTWTTQPTVAVTATDNGYVGQLATIRKIGLGEGVIGTDTNFDGSSDITIPVTEVKGSYVTWGAGKNSKHKLNPIDASLVNENGSNLFAFLPATAITIQYSNNGGSTWSTYSTSDKDKINTFNGNNAYHKIGNASSTPTTSDQLRYIVNTDTSTGLYAVLNKFAIYMSAGGSRNCKCTIEARTKSNKDAGSNTWKALATNVIIDGDSGWNIINIEEITTYGNSSSASTQYADIRFTFKITTQTAGGTGLRIGRIQAYGSMCYKAPSNLATNGHMYTYDYQQNVTFPGEITATKFNGPATKLSNTSAVGSLTQPVYFTSGGVPAACTYKLPVLTVNTLLGVSEAGASITTTEFITLLTNKKAFDTGYAIYRGTWNYSGNHVITDTGCGNIQLAGATVEVIGTSSAYTIRIHTATKLSNNAAGVKGEESRTFIYCNNGSGYSPGWHKLAKKGESLTASYSSGVLTLSV